MQIFNNSYTINDIAYNIESLDRYSCSICYEFIFKKEIYQCKEGHWCCKECWIQMLKKVNKCPICDEIINSIKDLGRCRFIEKEFMHQKVYCPNSREFKYNNNNNNNSSSNISRNSSSSSSNSNSISSNIIQNQGCSEILTFENLENHLNEECKFKFINCPNNGCNIVSRVNKLDSHLEECEYKTIKCENGCGEIELTKLNISNHIQFDCPNVIIKCLQNCTNQIYRGKLKNHIKDDCPNTIIPCKYSFNNYGCNIKDLKRNQLVSHLKLIDHTSFIDNIIELQKLEINNLSNKVNILEDDIQDYYHYKNDWIISTNLKTKPFSSYYPSESIKSPIIKIGLDKKFRFSFYPNGDCEENKGYISIFLFPQNLIEPLKVSFSVTIKCNTISNAHMKIVDVFKDNIGWGKERLIINKTITKENGYFKGENDDLCLEVSIEILDNKPQSLKTNCNKDII